ncbi:hypothetical protein [Nonomuraea dietziae]
MTGTARGLSPKDHVDTPGRDIPTRLLGDKVIGKRLGKRPS